MQLPSTTPVKAAQPEDEDDSSPKRGKKRARQQPVDKEQEIAFRRARNKRHAQKSRAKKRAQLEQAQEEANQCERQVHGFLQQNEEVYTALLAQFGEDWLALASEIGWKRSDEWLQQIADSDA